MSAETPPMRMSDCVVAAVAFGTFLTGMSMPTLGAPQAGALPAAPSGQAPAPAEGTSAVSGVVTDATTDKPVAGVMVYLGFQGRGAVGRLSRQISDEKGRFVFTDLPAGANYFINASKPGYLDGHYGVGAGGLLGGLITLTGGQWFAAANVKMDRLGSISGTVLDDSGEPVVGAFVRVLARIRVAGREQLAAGVVAVTDDRGMYRLSALTPGRYAVQVPSVQQSFPASMTTAELAGIPADQVGPGRVLPDPPPAIEVNDGSRLIVGSYGLPLATGRPEAYPPMFYPRALTVDTAAVIDIKPGEDRKSVDFSLSPVPVSNVSGLVSGPPDVLPGLVVRLVPEGLEDLGAGSEVATATIDSSGRFTLLHVPHGAYVVDIRRSLSELQYRTPLTGSTVSLPPTPGVRSGGSGGGSILSGPRGATYSTRNGRGSSAYYAQMKLTVGEAPLANLEVPLKRGASIRGRFVTTTGASPFPDRTSTPIYAEPADGNLGLGMITGSRPTPETFEIEGLLAGDYLIRFVGLGNMSVMSITSDGIDHRNKPFDGSSGRDFDVVVTLTDQKVDLSGTASDSRGAPVEHAIVIAFPVERDQWTNYGLSPVRMKGSPTTSSGTYRFQSLPAGDYYLIGVPAEQADIWQDPAKLAVMAGQAKRVTLAWGDVKKLDVTVVKVQ